MSETTEPTSEATDETPEETTAEEGAPDATESDAEPAVEHESETERSVAEGPRSVAFEAAADALADVFDLDRRRGETITDLETAETEDGRQLVATVERSRATALRHRVKGAKRVGRRVGGGAAVLGTLAAVAYLAFTVRRVLNGGRGESEESETGDELGEDGGDGTSLDEPHAIDDSSPQ